MQAIYKNFAFWDLNRAKSKPFRSDIFGDFQFVCLLFHQKENCLLATDYRPKEAKLSWRKGKILVLSV